MIFEKEKSIQELYNYFNGLKQEIEIIKKEHQQEIEIIKKEHQQEIERENNELKEELERQSSFHITKLREISDIQQELRHEFSTFQQQAEEKFNTISSLIKSIQQEISLIQQKQAETNQKFENMHFLHDEISSLKTTLKKQDNKVSQLSNLVDNIYLIAMKKEIQDERIKEFTIP